MAAEVFSIGHSDLSFDRFLTIVNKAGINAIADVRSSPFSRRSPWFSQPEFKTRLQQNEIVYAFLGEELGGRPKVKSTNLFKAGVADYSAMAEMDTFKSGLDRLILGSKKHQIAMVCSERDPLHCHRCLLVGRQLAILGVTTRHIHANGSEETQGEAEERLLREEKLAAEDLLWPRLERLSEAYMRRNRQVAYSLNSTKHSASQWHNPR